MLIKRYSNNFLQPVAGFSPTLLSEIPLVWISLFFITLDMETGNPEP